MGSKMLGPQCLSCRRRRVKCDSTTPTCKRCWGDDIDCPGYNKQLKWNYYHPATPSRTRRSPPSTNSDDGSAVESVDDQDTFTLSIPHPIVWASEENLSLMDSIQFLNLKMVPLLMPAHPPFKRQHYYSVFWNTMPNILKYLVIHMVWSVRSQSANSTTLAKSEVCRYRGLTIQELKAYLPDATSEPHGIALGCIIALLLNSLQDATNGSWLDHLKAARRVVADRGGLRECVQTLPDSRATLINYMMVDVLTTTTRNVLYFDMEAIRSQAQYPWLVELYDTTMVEMGHPFPPRLLRRVIQINVLRARVPESSRDKTDITSLTQMFEAIRQALEQFDVDIWAAAVTLYGRTHPEVPDAVASTDLTAAWVNLALCYKMAALLYCCLSCPKLSSSSWSGIDEMKMKLVNHISNLFCIASDDPDGPVESQLWKFIVWPVVISAYIQVGWYPNDEKQVEAEIGNLEWLAKAPGVRMLSRAPNAIRKIWERRKLVSNGWKWDLGFDMQDVFLL